MIECESTYCECDDVARAICNARLNFEIGPVVQPYAFKADEGKPRWSLLMHGCAHALLSVVKVLTFAVTAKPKGKGYIPHSWKQVPEAKERYKDALYRHLAEIENGVELDPESGESHWAHVATNALFLCELHKEK